MGWTMTSRIAGRLLSTIAVAGVVAATVAGCGLDVASADLFVLTRTGQGKPLTLLVNDGGTIRCDGGKAKPLSDSMLLDARQLASDLDTDAQNKLHLLSSADSVSNYKVVLQDGTITFPDTAGRTHSELARAELFTVQVAQTPCGLGG
jgi:hypothetical protein